MPTAAYPMKFLLFLVLAMLLGFVGWFIYHETRVPQTDAEVLNRMTELFKEGRYDNAVQVAENWMKDTRRDTSRDASLYQQIAFTYIAKAGKKQSTRDDSMQRAEENLQKAEELFNRETRGGLSLDPFEIGGAYEILGDLSIKDRCRFYAKARELFTKQLPLIEGDTFTMAGHTTRLGPVRKDVRKHLDAVMEKSSVSGCSAENDQKR